MTWSNTSIRNAKQHLDWSYDIQTPIYWEISYDIHWRPICHICCKAFNKLLSHVRQKHDMDWRTYRITFWLDLSKWIMSQSSIEKARTKALENYDKVIKVNLLEKGKDTRFIQWHWKLKYISEQTKNMLRNRRFKKK